MFGHIINYKRIPNEKTGEKLTSERHLAFRFYEIDLNRLIALFVCVQTLLTSNRQL